MNGSEQEQFKKDWITTLASTSGIMLTICLMVLAILYTGGSSAGWQRALAVTPIVGASLCFIIAALGSLNALGTLILASTHRAERETEKMKTAENLTATRAKKAQGFFKAGLWFLVVAICFSFLLLNWPVITSWWNKLVN